MRKTMIALLIVVAVSMSGCFKATVDTDYNADASKMLTGHPKIPATAALIISEEQRDRSDSASKLGIRVSVKTGESLVGINKAAVGQVFENIVMGDAVGARTDADMLLEPKVNDVITQVHGIGIIVHVTAIAKFSLTAYDKDANQIWTKNATGKFESPSMFGLKMLAQRNQVAKDVYESFLPGWKEIYEDFYASEEVMGYLRGIGKAP